MNRLAVAVLLAACHGKAPPATTGSATSCAGKLDELARFYEAVAADNETVKPHAGLDNATIEADMRTLPAATGAPADLSQADVLLVGTLDAVLVSSAGEIVPRVNHLEAPDASRALVLEIDERVPWQRVEEVRQILGRTDNRYHAVAVAYRTQHALAGRAPPHPPGAGSGGIDIPTIGNALAKTTAEHCPAYAKQLAALQTGGGVSDPALLRALARTISQCDCAVDFDLLETMPWLVAAPLVTAVPLADSAPPLHGADSATWGDLVREAKGPVPMAMPAPLPPPPPPPPRHRR
jgi:hypothetical protein